MKFTILGYSQIRLIEYGLDTIDAVLLRYFVDFKDSGSMIKEKIDSETYYWLKYDGVLRELPILNLKRDTVYRRLKKMSKNNILKHKTIKRNGIYSYFDIGENYIKLISDFNPTAGSSNPRGCELKSDPLTDSEPVQKINLQEDNLIKDISNKYTLIISYLNNKAGTSYKQSTKKTQQLIKSKFKEGFTTEDFYKVIDNKVSEWVNTDMEKYIRPETLFGPKFEGYLNQKGKGGSTIEAGERDSKKLQQEGVGFSV